MALLSKSSIRVFDSHRVCQGLVAQSVERSPHKGLVSGSIPGWPTKYVLVAQLEERQIEILQVDGSAPSGDTILPGSSAVEQQIDNLLVESSNLSPATTTSYARIAQFGRAASLQVEGPAFKSWFGYHLYQYGGLAQWKCSGLWLRVPKFDPLIRYHKTGWPSGDGSRLLTFQGNLNVSSSLTPVSNLYSIIAGMDLPQEDVVRRCGRLDLVHYPDLGRMKGELLADHEFISLSVATTRAMLDNRGFTRTPKQDEAVEAVQTGNWETWTQWVKQEENPLGNACCVQFAFSNT